MKKTPKKRPTRMTVRGVVYRLTREPDTHWGTWEGRHGTILYESKTAKVKKWHVDHPLKRDCMISGPTPDDVLHKAHRALLEKALRDINRAWDRFGGPIL